MYKYKSWRQLYSDIVELYSLVRNRKPNMPFYAVANGRKPGIYKTWAECETQTKGFPRPKFKKFSTKEEAEDFITSYSSGEPSSSQPSKSKSKRFEPYTRPAPTSRQSSSSSSSNNTYSSAAFMVSCSNSKTHVDEKGYVHVYTDGACSSNGQTGASAGIGVFFGPNHPMNVSRPVEGRPTNNVAEIEAANAAVSQARNMGHSKVVVNTDSEFMIKSMTQWVPRWEKNGWQTAAGAEVKNRTEFQNLSKAMSGMDVQFNHVRGHNGDYGNEAADVLARGGAAAYSRSRPKN